MTERLSVAIRTTNDVGFILRSGGQVLNVGTLLLETFASGNYASYIVAGTRVGGTPLVEAAVPAGSPAAKYDVTPLEAVGSDGVGLGGFAEAYDQTAGGTFSIQWNGDAIVDALGTDVDPLVALVTLAEAKMYCKESGAEADTILAFLVNACSEWVKNEVGRDLVSKSQTEYYHGDGSDLLMLERRPVVSITSIHVDSNREWAAASLVETTNYRIDKKTGMVTAWNLFGSWTGGGSNIRVIYNAGYTVGPAGTMPKDLKLAVCRLIDLHYLSGYTHRKLDTASESIGDANISFRDGDLPKEVRAILDKYRSYMGSPQFDYVD